MLFVILSVTIFVWGNWHNFKKLRPADLNGSTEGTPKTRDTYKELFKLKISDRVSMLAIVIPALYWIYLGFNLSEGSVFMVIMVMLSLTSMFLILICVKKVFFDSLNRIHKSIIYKLDFSFSATA